MGWGGVGGKRRGCTPSGSYVPQGAYLKGIGRVMCVCVSVRASMCECVCCQDTHAAPPPQRRREIFIWPLGALRVSEFLTSLISPRPHPRPCPLHPLHRKWAGPGVLVFAGLISQLLPGLPESGVRVGAGPWGDGCGPSSGEIPRECVAAPCLSQVTALPLPLYASPGTWGLPPRSCHLPRGWK